MFLFLRKMFLFLRLTTSVIVGVWLRGERGQSLGKINSFTFSYIYLRLSLSVCLSLILSLTHPLSEFQLLIFTKARFSFYPDNRQPFYLLKGILQFITYIFSYRQSPQIWHYTCILSECHHLKCLDDFWSQRSKASRRSLLVYIYPWVAALGKTTSL